MLKYHVNILALVLIIGMVLVSTGCDNIKKESKSGEVPTISYMLPSDPGLNFTGDSWVFQNWGEKTGVKIEINSPPRDSFNVKIAALFASGQLPDLINYYQDVNTKYYKQYGPQFFVALDSYLQQGKLDGLKKYLDKYPDIRTSMNHPEDGKLYGFPLIYDCETFDVVWSIRNDILKKGGMDASQIKTLEDFKRALLTLKKESAQKYIASARLGWNNFGVVMARFFGTDIDVGYDNRLPGGTNQFIYAPAYPQYKKMLEFLHWMYENEILHPSFSTMEQQELFAGYKEGKFLVCMERSTTGLQLSGGDNTREEKPVYPVEIDGIIPKQPRYPHQNNGFRWPVTISKTSPNIESCVRMMNWLYTDEGILQTLMGQEGVHWTKDENYFGGARLTGLQGFSNSALVKAGKMTKEQYDALPKANDLGGLGQYWIMSVIPDYYRFGLMDKPKDIGKTDPSVVYVKDVVADGIGRGYTTGKFDPVVDFSKQELDDLAAIKTTLNTYTNESTMKFITGAMSFDQWNEYLAYLEKIGYKKVEEMYNKKLAALRK